MLDYHNARVGDIDSDFDHRGRNQNVELAFLEHSHDLLFQVGFHSAVQHRYTQVGEDFLAQLGIHLHRGFELRFFVFFDDRIHDVGLMSRRNLLPQELPDFI